MTYRILLLALVTVVGAAAQGVCPGLVTYTPCDIVLQLNDAEAAAHPQPYLTVDMHAEFRSPHADTYLMNAFWDGDRRMVIRFAPMAAGHWDFRISSNLKRFDGQLGSFSVSASDSKGFVRTANFHHFSYTEHGVRPIPHLWMGDTSYRFAVMDRGLFEQMVDEARRAGVQPYPRTCLRRSTRLEHRLCRRRYAAPRVLPGARPAHPLHERARHHRRPPARRRRQSTRRVLPHMAAAPALYPVSSCPAMRR